MAVTLTDLLKGADRDTLLARALLFLRAKTMPVMAWQPGNPWRTLLELLVELAGDNLRSIQLTGTGGFLSYAEGPSTPEGFGWIDLLLWELFDLERKPATFAVHELTLADVASVGPVSITAGQVVALGPGALEFTALADATVPLDGSVKVNFQARSPGSAYNVPVGTIASFGTDLPGVSVVNNAIGTTGTSLVSAGLDRETPAEARVRARARWSLLGRGATRGAYQATLLESSNEIRRVVVLENTPSDGKVTAYVASPSGPAPQAALDAAVAAVETMRPLGVQAFVLNAVAQTVTVSGTVFCKTGRTAEAQAEVAANLLAYQSTLPLGDKVPRAQVVEEIMRPSSVNNVDLLQPVADVTPGAGNVIVFQNILAFAEGT